ncbi:hypothetical protein AC1031_014785 [Aphanomyces cochlioides]|nr:hypothetical protein AC1031_014785 [Aphanomyces cochlioides]
MQELTSAKPFHLPVVLPSQTMMIHSVVCRSCCINTFDGVKNACGNQNPPRFKVHLVACSSKLMLDLVDSVGLFSSNTANASGEVSSSTINDEDPDNSVSFDASTVLLGHTLLSGLALSPDKVFDEEHFVSPQYKYQFIRVPMLHPLTFYKMDKVTSKTHIPSVDEIFRFCKNLFNRAQLSAECTIVCLIYIERLMERANIPLLGSSWKPIVLCGLLLASKVWQDLSSWNVEISNVYPQFPLHSINRLERLFLHYIQWDLYISGSVYAKYYFALRSLTEKKDFRRRYNYTIKIDPPNSKRLEERSAAVKNELYSRSL